MKLVSEYKNIYYLDETYTASSDIETTVYPPGYYIGIEVYHGDREDLVVDIYGPFATLMEAVDNEPKVLTKY